MPISLIWGWQCAIGFSALCVAGVTFTWEQCDPESKNFFDYFSSFFWTHICKERSVSFKPFSQVWRCWKCINLYSQQETLNRKCVLFSFEAHRTKYSHKDDHSPPPQCGQLSPGSFWSHTHEIAIRISAKQRCENSIFVLTLFRTVIVAPRFIQNALGFYFWFSEHTLSETGSALTTKPGISPGRNRRAVAKFQLPRSRELCFFSNIFSEKLCPSTLCSKIFFREPLGLLRALRIPGVLTYSLAYGWLDVSFCFFHIHKSNHKVFFALLFHFAFSKPETLHWNRKNENCWGDYKFFFAF